MFQFQLDYFVKASHNSGNGKLRLIDFDDHGTKSARSSNNMQPDGASRPRSPMLTVQNAGL